MSAGSRSAPASGVMVALARVEGRKLIGHPVFVAGVGFALIGSASFVRAMLTDGLVSWEGRGWTVSVGFALVAILTLMAANLATLRDRREDTVEQHTSLPVGAQTRTGGLLGALLWPTAVATVLLAAIVGFAATRGTHLTGVEVVHLVETICLVPLLGALGIAIGVWVPSPFVAPLVGWALFLVSPGEQPASWQAIAPFVGLRSAELQVWHLAYLGGLTLVFAIVALERSSRRRSLLVAGIVAVGIVVVSTVVLIGNACPIEGPCVL